MPGRRWARFVLYAVFAVASIAYLLLQPAGREEQAGRPGSEPISGARIFADRCAVCHGPSGSGGVGPPLSAVSLRRQFPQERDQVAFVLHGSRAGERYGQFGRGTGGMPGFAGVLSEAEVDAVVRYERSL